ncbi:efflux RND transporter periplasmic adaptor subunit [Treponema endosymbiont of Eucomonympha sp.]|uniref:efflux RND transporter periplasmic adaptor subunit n=1 Tax=Treponema endosymbiont of Eucomonympha sp. TaxID=1580831 RepID=UPI000784A8FE|nr:efflux RND transporter periplasmic adaptor subunit [Treponema endosymbiont of Eucomonympha sp.]
MNYAKSPVRAPIAGTVTSLPMPVGATVSPGVSLGKISTANDLEITVDIAERFVSRIRLGQAALISFDAYPAETFPARVAEVSPVLNVASRTMQAKLRLDSADSRIKIGMYAQVRLITDERKNVVAVPYDALVRRAGDAFVFAASGGRARLIPVREGIRVDDRVEILSGLEAGDEIVVKGQTLLSDGNRINVVAKAGGEGAE